jgi:hypothetical protein
MAEASKPVGRTVDRQAVPFSGFDPYSWPIVAYGSTADNNAATRVPVPAFPGGRP